MASVARWTGPGRRRALEAGFGLVDYTDAQLSMLLVSAGHVYTAQQTAADVVAEELVAGGYARQLLTGFSVSVGPDLVARAQHDAVDFGILAGGASIGGAYIFDAAGSADASRELLIFIAFEGDTDGTSVIVQPSTPAIEIS